MVSAHYPPNFVSGGTLVPQRIARGLAERGHQVEVFAGHLDETAEPLTIHHEHDSYGVDITWVNITPFTSWDHEENYRNPQVERHFSTWLDRVRPEVVHFHSLQTLGGSLVPAAKRAGCRTIVTMHDFWWFCTRQFLVDPWLRPCSLVVDAGGCACQSGRRALEARLDVLRSDLASADQVLAPSEIAASVLRANGVPASRLGVNENGMEDHDPTTRPDPGRGPVRFRYTGGADPMKGARVLAEALAYLTDIRPDRWRLDLHASDTADAHVEEMGRHPSVDVRAPYPPSELDEVLNETDVLVLPSVMRETHSIMTREALLHGVPVITSDSLGPEQVVHDGQNGYVVPTGDAEALAAAMRRTIEEPETLRRLQQGCASLTPVSIDQQVGEVERRLQASPDGTERWTPDSVLYVVGIDGAPLRYRAQFPAEALTIAGVEAVVLHYSDPRVERAMTQADVIIAYRVPATERIVQLLDRARTAGRVVIFDVDDLIVDPDVLDEIPALRILEDDEAKLWVEGVRRYRTTLEHCDAFMGSTTALVDAVGSATGTPSYRKQNAYGLQLAQLSDAALRSPRRSGPLRVGYLSGTKTHDEDLRAVLPALVEILGRHQDVELWLGGHLPSDPRLDPFGDRVRRLPFVQWFELPETLRQLDVNLAPLADLDRFNEAKSAIKWLEAALVGTPTVATASGAFREAITDGHDGVLVTHPGTWVDAIDALLSDSVRRRSIGGAARRTALLEWSPHLQSERLLEVFRAVRAHDPDRSGDERWVDVAPREPAAVGEVALSPYPADGRSGVDTTPRPGAREPRLVAKLVWSLRNEGLRKVAQRTLGRVRRG